MNVRSQEGGRRSRTNVVFLTLLYEINKNLLHQKLPKIYLGLRRNIQPLGLSGIHMRDDNVCRKCSVDFSANSYLASPS